MGGRLRDGRAVVPDVAGEPAESRLRTRPARGTTKRKQNEAIHSPIPETRRKREVRLRLESVTHPHSPVRGGGSETRRDTKHRTETSIGSRCGDKRTQDPVERANNTCRYC